MLPAGVINPTVSKSFQAFVNGPRAPCPLNGACHRVAILPDPSPLKHWADDLNPPPPPRQRYGLLVGVAVGGYLRSVWCVDMCAGAPRMYCVYIGSQISVSILSLIPNVFMEFVYIPSSERFLLPSVCVSILGLVCVCVYGSVCYPALFPLIVSSTVPECESGFVSTRLCWLLNRAGYRVVS